MLTTTWRVALFGFPLCLFAACGSDESTPSSTGGAANAGNTGVSGDAGGPESSGGRGGGAAGGRGGKPGSAGEAGGGVGGEAGATHEGFGGRASGGNPSSGGHSGGSSHPEGGSFNGGATSAGSGGDDAGAGGVGLGGSNTGGNAGTNGGTLSTAGTGGAPGPISLEVDVNQDAHAISPLIYGINPPHTSCSNALARFTLCRLGGNPWSTYNWENNASNAGADRCNENNDALGASNEPAASVLAVINEASTNLASTVVTIPMLDRVAADKQSGTAAPDCSGDVGKTANYLEARFRKNQAEKGSAFDASPNLSDNQVSQDEFLNYLKPRVGTASLIFALDNQPELWMYTHPRLRSTPTSYEEVVELDTRYASMIRQRWPDAAISGFVGYGYQAFIDLQGAPNHPDSPTFLDYYLTAMKQKEVEQATRLIDYLDIHWYSEAQGFSDTQQDWVRVINDDTTPGVVAARVQAPRSLWDATYSEHSWVAGAGPIRLLPWINDKITTNYPGTKLGISAWAYGGEGHISGALAVADALGVFGKHGVGFAAAELPNAQNAFALAGFAVYRNYDGQGSSFGDVSVSATTNDVERVSVYASRDSTVSGRTVIVAINRSAAQQSAQLHVQSATSYAHAKVYVLSDAAPAPQAGAELVAASANAFALSLPAYSATVVVPKP